jgi:uncharacterized integral membrane protein (TIGR00698 family)
VTVRSLGSGVVVAIAAAVVAWALHSVWPAAPLLTIAVVLGIAVGQFPAFRRARANRLGAGLRWSARTPLRAGIVLLGLQLSLVDIVALGPVTIATTVAIVVVTFFATWWLGRLLGLSGQQPLLVASGFSICGASAIGAMAHAVRARDEDQSIPVALVTLCGTLAIAILPLLRHPLGLTDAGFGHWVGASVHDVGQVVATAQIAGTTALAVAVVVKLTRVVLLAPMVAVASGIERRRSVEPGARPPIVPLFIVGFLAAVALNTLVPLPGAVLETAGFVQTALLTTALFALGTSVDVTKLAATGWRALVVGLTSWALIATLAYGAVLVG